MRSVRSSRSAGTLFAVWAAVFLCLLAAVELWFAVDQYRLLENLYTIQKQSLPQALEQQRLVRNLEAMRLEGERVLNSHSEQERQQAKFVVALLSSHPSMRSNDASLQLAEQVHRFIVQDVRHADNQMTQEQEWETLSRGLVVLADQITVRGVEALGADVGRMTDVLEQGEKKLWLALFTGMAAMAALLALVLYVFVKPLQQIDRVLTSMPGNSDLLPLPEPRAREIQTINQAIVHLHDTLRENESIRAGLEVMATTDALTGLNNRRHFMEQAHLVLARAQRHNRPLTIGMVDLDHFKKVNDQYGHAAGDLVLKVASSIMRDTLRQTDLLCRYGGEEFAFLLPETTPDEAHALAERLRMRLEAETITVSDGRRLHVTASIGLLDAARQDLEAALNGADKALYTAKAAGRNRIQRAMGTA